MPMRVLVCIPCLFTGGTEIQTLSLVRALREAGHEVDVACYYEHSSVIIERYRAAGAEVHLLSPEGTRAVGMRAQVRHLWRGLRRLVRERKPDVAHVQYMNPGALPIILLRLMGVKRIVATAHTAADIYSPRGLQLLRWLNGHVLSAFQCITLRAEESFFGSGGFLEEALPFRRRHGNHFTVYNSLPAELEVNLDIRPRDPRCVGVVSRLEGIKGMDMVVPAFARTLEILRAEGVPTERLELLVVGDGSIRSEMERQARELGVAERVRFEGRQPQEKLQGYYDSIDILLMPSRSEGFGLTAVEGMARGCVPVVADVGGLPEVVRDRVDGLLHPAEDPESLAQKITELLQNPELHAQMRQSAPHRAATFTRPPYTAAIARLYRALPT